jgi:hypothetical protein
MSKQTAFAAAGLAIVIAAAGWMVASPVRAQMMGPGYGPGMMYGPGGPSRVGPEMMGPGMMGPGGMMGGCPMMGMTTDGQALTFAEGRIAFLKAELGITDAQTSVWNAYAAVIKRNLQSMQGMWQTMKTVYEAKTPVDRLNAHITAMDGRLAVLKDVKPALETLYAALSADQKKKADEILTSMGCMM